MYSQKIAIALKITNISNIANVRNEQKDFLC